MVSLHCPPPTVDDDSGRIMIGRICFIFTLLCSAVALGDAPKSLTLDPVSATTTWLTLKDSSVAPVFSPVATARSFDRDTLVNVADLAGRFAGARVLATLVYPHAPATLAADLSKQLSAIKDLPAGALLPLIVNGDPARANVTAVAWVQDRLSPAPTDSVAVCVLWGREVRPVDVIDLPDAPKLFLVLIKIQHPSPTQSLISRIEFGEPAAVYATAK